MGSFAGHIDEGIFFIILATWWMFNVYVDFIFRQDKGKEFIPRFSYQLPGKRRVPVEICFKIAFPVVGFLAELIDSGAKFLDDEGNFMNLIYMQHVTIYGMFIIHGITDLLMYYDFPLPAGTHYLTVAIAFFWYGIGFYFHAHMHGKEPLEEIVHVLPVPVMLATGLTVLCEMMWKKGVATALVRTYFVLTLGTWFSHVAFILYDHTKFPGSDPSNYDRHDHRNVAFAAAAFGMHLCFNLIFMVVSYVVTYYVVRGMYGVRVTNSYCSEEVDQRYKKVQSDHSDDSAESFLMKDCDF
ncbi:transmembrane protein 45B-like [Haliotis rubra]|uniref:transmembrane protein 45B-like n=1 Tax=Haliotis rubra TaxID=36100 RepID=UPI001EE4F377|nr:transmembrane protein 45B-like [Haliotis rubra]